MSSALNDLLVAENFNLKKEIAETKGVKWQLLQDLRNLQKQYEGLLTSKFKIGRIVQQRKKDYYNLQILDVKETPSGVFIEVGN